MGLARGGLFKFGWSFLSQVLGQEIVFGGGWVRGGRNAPPSSGRSLVPTSTARSFDRPGA